MSKYTTIAQIKADIKLSYAKILDFYSEIQADAHGMAYLIVEMKDNTTLAELEALYFTPAVITDMEGKNIYSGICVDIPYEAALSNSFYCMPDEKVLTNKENMIRFTSLSLIVTDTRKKLEINKKGVKKLW